jgi:polyribonucleotide nucleotidyltransferase
LTTQAPFRTTVLPGGLRVVTEAVPGVRSAAFGAFVSLTPGKDGLVHISKLGNGKRINKVEDVVNVGDKIQVEIQDIDQRGMISLIPVSSDAPAEAAPAVPAE